MRRRTQPESWDPYAHREHRVTKEETEEDKEKEEGTKRVRVPLRVRPDSTASPSEFACVSIVETRTIEKKRKKERWRSDWVRRNSVKSEYTNSVNSSENSLLYWVSWKKRRLYIYVCNSLTSKSSRHKSNIRIGGIKKTNSKKINGIKMEVKRMLMDVCYRQSLSRGTIWKTLLRILIRIIRVTSRSRAIYCPD